MTNVYRLLTLSVGTFLPYTILVFSDLVVGLLILHQEN